MSNLLQKQKDSLFGQSTTRKYVDNFNPIAPNIRKKIADITPAIAGGSTTSTTPSEIITTNQILVNSTDKLLINGTDTLEI